MFTSKLKGLQSVAAHPPTNSRVFRMMANKCESHFLFVGVFLFCFLEGEGVFRHYVVSKHSRVDVGDCVAQQ